MMDRCVHPGLSFNPCGVVCRLGLGLSGVSCDESGHRLSSSCVSCEVRRTRQAVAVAFIMSWDVRGGGVSGGDAAGALAGFRREVYSCLEARADALFEACDAGLCAGGGVALA